MIISHEYQYIFIRTYKTAGSSVELSLARYLGPLDVLTPDHPDDEDVRRQYDVVPQNFSINKGRSHQAASCQSHDIPQNESQTYNNLPLGSKIEFGVHNRAAHIKLLVGDKIWRRYTKFCIERNPFEFLISLYYWNLRKEKYAGFLDFLEKNRDTGHNWPSYFINKQIAVDVIIDYANLQPSLTSLAKSLGMDFDGWLPNLKSQYRLDKRPWHEILGPREIAYISQHWRLDIELYSALINHSDPRLRACLRP